MTERTRAVVFPVCALCAVAAAAFHAAAMASPAVARIEYESTYPAWRHVLFIVIDVAAARLLLIRQPWFVWAYAVLTIQVLNGHGRGAWQLWVDHQRFDWISAAISLAAPAILVLLLVDRRDRARTLRSNKQ